MPTYASPVTLAAFQTYLKDTSTDPALTAFYQSLLDTATEYVYNWLDRDYTASATKTDTFFGDDSPFHAPRNPVGTLLTWVYADNNGVTTTVGVLDLLLRANGYLIQAKTKYFQSGVEHRLSYQQPSTLVCPETVQQVITEFAAILFTDSQQGSGQLELFQTTARDAFGTGRERFLDLTEHHKELLRPYKRYPV
jgi:hypothetical protein